MATITTTVEIDLDDFDTDELVYALRYRAKKGDKEAAAIVAQMAPVINGMSDWEADNLRAAMLADDGRRVIDLLRPHLQPYPAGHVGRSVLPFKREAA